MALFFWASLRMGGKMGMGSFGGVMEGNIWDSFSIMSWMEMGFLLERVRVSIRGNEKIIN